MAIAIASEVNPTQDGKEIPAIWFKNGDPQLLISSFNRDPSFIFLPLDWTKATLEAAECIYQTQEAQIVNGSAARHSETHRKVLAQMYSKHLLNILKKINQI